MSECPTVWEAAERAAAAHPEGVRLNGKPHGSTPAAEVPGGYLVMVHRSSDQELGRVYSHKWALLSRDFPHLPRYGGGAGVTHITQVDPPTPR